MLPAPSSAPTIRRAVPADGPGLFRLYSHFHTKLARLVPTEDDLRAAVDALIAHPRVLIHLATNDRGLLGYLLCRRGPGGQDAVIEDVFVAADARRRGVARSLMQAALADPFTASCTSVFVETDADNAAALRLYRSFGFSEVAATMQTVRLQLRRD